MKKIEESKKEEVIEEKTPKKSKKIIVIATTVLLVVVACLYFLVFRQSEEEKLTKILTELGSDFYENFYCNQVGKTDEERVAFLKRFEEIGIKISLDNLARYKVDGDDAKNAEIEEKVKLFVNKSTSKECNKDDTKVTIYPQSPYSNTSYKIEANLDCGFDK